MTRAATVAQVPAGTAHSCVRLATRRSPLALAQSRLVGAQLAAAAGRGLELVEVTTHGDLDPGPLAQIGGVGVFVTAVREAVLEGRAQPRCPRVRTPGTRW